jgi:hypothetical protein
MKHNRIKIGEKKHKAQRKNAHILLEEKSEWESERKGSRAIKRERLK